MLIKEWLAMFLERHKVRNPRSDWPPPDSNEGRDLWRGYLDGFVGLKVKKSEADAASVQLSGGGESLDFVEDHLLWILERVQWNRGAIEAMKETKAAATTAQSVGGKPAGDCPHCGGHGLVTCFHPGYIGLPTVEVVDAVGMPKMIPARIAAHCTCPVGRWIRQRTEPDLIARIPDAAPVIEGRSRWTLKDPTTPDLPNGCHEGMTFSEFWAVIQRPGGPIQVKAPAGYPEPGSDN